MLRKLVDIIVLGIVLALITGMHACVTTQNELPENFEHSDLIRLNQLGYYPDAPKKAVFIGEQGEIAYEIYDLESKKSVFKGRSGNLKEWAQAGDHGSVGDFSSLVEPGRYIISAKGVGYSYPFRIAENIYKEALVASAKSYYFQRASTALDSSYAGIYSRPIGHPDDRVEFHRSTGRSGYRNSSRGWYDAGDYGKYVVNGAFSMGEMLLLHEQYPHLLSDGILNIPQSGNGVPDLLDELKYEMDWLLTMQDSDGGVFFKLTALGFGGMALPHKVKKPRFIIGKSTSSSLDFAAIAAKMYRAFKPYNEVYAALCLDASKRAWKWANENPAEFYTNPSDVKTGEYPDKDMSQEFFWAAAELYISTLDDEYLKFINTPTSFAFSENESWANFMHFIGAFAIVDHFQDSSLGRQLRKEIINTADFLLQEIKENDYLQPIDEFHWGSNSDVLNAAIIISQAYRLTSKQEYLSGVRETIDYIFGKNALGYSFLTGYGSKTPLNLHHRPSAGDGIIEPIPGFLSGGPNFGKHDAHNVIYPEEAPPMKCWVDTQKSFASNEVCINWNAPLVYVLGFLESNSSKKVKMKSLE